ncbi:MAG: uracil-DNA glycosylase [Patescibacteria group bacterium]
MSETKTLKNIYTELKSKFQDKKLVFGVGAQDAKIVFVGEMPGPDEIAKGSPIAGSQEKLLNQLLKSAGINKKKTYFTNVVKYHPNGNMPSPKEIKAHAAFLREEIKAINPSIVVTLGTLALNGVGMRQPLGNVHGKIFSLGDHDLLPTFHPTHALRDPNTKTLLEADFVKLKDLVITKLSV